MKILQLIDSLETGGAERMAVNYANGLAREIEWSGLAVSRKEGDLKQTLSSEAHYFFLGKQSTVDLKAIFLLRKICKQHKVDFIHAHSSSWFLALCVRFLLPSLKVIWHDHYGLSEFLDKRPSRSLAFGSFFFFGILSVNLKLRDWAKSRLNCQNAMYLPNFASVSASDSDNGTRLKGEDGKRIICLANLRPQKDHLMLLDAFSRCDFQDWTLHLVGKDFEDGYAREVRSAVSALDLDRNVFIYGALNDIDTILEQCEIGVLSSKSEGLPVSLIEYGFKSMATLTTRVGEIPTVIEHRFNGLMCEAGNAVDFAHLLSDLLANAELRRKLGHNLYETVSAGYSEHSVINKYLNFLDT